MKLPERIETERLLIRPFKLEDFEPYLEFITDDQATRYLLFNDDQKTVEGARELLDFIITSYETDEPVFACAIALKNDLFIGSCGISAVAEGGVNECYYSLLPRYWGKGYASEATEALIRYCFKHLDVSEMRAYIQPGNRQGIEVAKRVGMKSDGSAKHPLFGIEASLYTINRTDGSDSS